MRIGMGIALIAVGSGLLAWFLNRPTERAGGTDEDADADASGRGPAPPAHARARIPRPGAEAPPTAHAAAPPIAPAPRGQGAEESANESAKENTATARIREIVRSDPDGALALIDAADRAHPGGPLAEERAALRVDALVFAQRIGVARDAAEEFLRRYPRSDRAQHIEMLTGVHPHPSED